MFCHLKELKNVKKDQRFFFTLLCTKRRNKRFLIDGEGFFDLPIKNEEALKKLMRWVEIITTQLVTYWISLISKKITYYAIDLSKQSKLKDPQQIHFIGKFENQANGATVFFIIEKSEEATSEFLQNSVNIL